jgi:hypothetical protein
VQDRIEKAWCELSRHGDGPEANVNAFLAFFTRAITQQLVGTPLLSTTICSGLANEYHAPIAAIFNRRHLNWMANEFKCPSGIWLDSQATNTTLKAESQEIFNIPEAATVNTAPSSILCPDISSKR